MMQSWRLSIPFFASALFALAAGAGCTVDASEGIHDEESLIQHCEEAASTLEQCGGEATDEFAEACRSDPTPESVEVIEEIAAAECEGEDFEGKADSWGARIFGAACTPVMLSGALTNRARNRGGGPIPREEREALRPLFGNLVDQIRVHYNASITTSWEVAGRTVEYGSFSGQNFGNDVYITDSYRPGDLSQMTLLAHEVQHAAQAHRAGGLRAQATEYCRDFYNSGFSYADHPLEEEARDVASDFRSCYRRGECR